MWGIGSGGSTFLYSPDAVGVFVLRDEWAAMREGLKEGVEDCPKNSLFCEAEED